MADVYRCVIGLAAALAALFPLAWAGPLLGQETLPAPRGFSPQGPSLPGPDPAAGQQVADVRVAGNKTAPLSKIVPLIHTRPGRPFSRAMIQEDIRRLNRSRMFISVRTEYQPSPGGLVVIFRVVERPMLQYVKYIGLRNQQVRNMEDATELKVGDPVDPYKISEGKRKIEELYKQEGFNLVRVTILEGNNPTDRGAVFLINEGPRQQVVGIEFEGNTIAGDSRLKTRIQSSSRWFAYFFGYLDLNQVDADVALLTKYYRNLGYLRARIGRELVFNEDQTQCTLRFVIDEGPRCEVRSVSFIGHQKFTNEALAENMLLKPGDYFDGPKLKGCQTILEQTYGSYGHIFAKISAEPRVSEDAKTMDLVFVVDEGARYRVGNIAVKIEGDNPHTNIRTVLNRIDLKPGDIVDVRKLRRSEFRIQRSGLFHVEPQRGIKPKIVVTPTKGFENEAIAGAGPSKKPASGGPSFRGQSPDDYRRRPPSGERVIDLQLTGRWKPQPPPASGAPHRAPRAPWKTRN